MHDHQLFALVIFFGSGALVIVFLSLFDVWLYRKWGVDATISRSVQRLGKRSPIFTFAFGLAVGLVVGCLACHFFWSQPPVVP